MEDYVEITERKIRVDEIVTRLARPEIGAVATFVGIVRESENGKPISHLEYEAYPKMAIAELKRLCTEIRGRWETIEGVAIVHRVGKIAVGETAVVIGLSAAHRSEVFDALRYAIDRLKKIVPIWKKEGGRWISED